MRKLCLKKRKFFPFITFFFFTVLSAAAVFYIAVSPVFAELAEAGLGNHVRSVLYSAILSVSENEDFKDLTEISRQNGKITGISLNSGKANEIRSVFASKANSILSKEEYSTFNIPLGNITGIPLFSGRGPKIPVKIVPLGNLDADIISEFSDAGINQTKHSVYIKAKAKVRLMAPFSSAVTETETTIPLSETVIVGEVPYLYASGTK